MGMSKDRGIALDGSGFIYGDFVKGNDESKDFIVVVLENGLWKKNRIEKGSGSTSIDLYDVNGVEIYSGDIVNLYEFGKYRFTGRVEYNNVFAAWDIVDLNNKEKWYNLQDYLNKSRTTATLEIVKKE